MKNRQFPAARTALALSAALALTALPQASWALGLGRLNVQSALGEALRAEIDITSLTPEEASSLMVRVAPPEAYRAAGVEYNSALAAAQATLGRRADGRPYLRVTSDRAVQEPFVDVILELTWASGKLVREFTLLFDPPSARQAPPVQAAAPTAPMLSPSPSTTQTTAAPASNRRATAPAPMPRPGAAPRAAAPAANPSAASAQAADGADAYKVRNGDTLLRIAGKVQRPGVVLDQMLVGLYKANPDAFVQSNMNRLKSGVVLSVPATDAIKAIGPAEAREVIQAQSSDFNSYRRRLAEGAPAAATEDAGRQAKGRVSAAVDDKKQAGSASADKLKLSGGAVKASAPDTQVSTAALAKERAAREAELIRNIEELRKLQQGTAAAQPGIGKPGPAATPAPAPATAQTTAQSAAPAPAAAPPIAAAPAPTPTQAVATSAAPATAAPAPTPTIAVPLPVAPAAMAVASAPAAGPAPTLATASKPGAGTGPSAAAPRGTEPGFLDALSDSPYVLPGAGALALVLLGLGLYRFNGRAKNKDRNDTSFLESRVQPDSFFGASGGQRVDTSDATAGGSSMGFSLSQLDAIGDVDPVAEADVYLAYGRDLQAEEILKEAMRTNPERMAVRTKLLEVYAKRRDTKGFELLAVQLFSLTKGAGQDWEKAQTMGLQIDPENPLYQPGGHPEAMLRDGDRVFIEPLGASTLPASALPQGAPGFGPSLPPPALDDGPLDLDLDLDLGGPADPPIGAMEATRPLATSALPAASMGGLDFDFTDSTSAAAPPAAPAASASPSSMMDFNLDHLSLDFPSEAAKSPRGPSTVPGALPDFGGFELSKVGAPGSTATRSPEEVTLDTSNPIARKLELAEEFRQIGDLEGARDLLEEVVAKSSGVQKAKAQSMLNNLG